MRQESFRVESGCFIFAACDRETSLLQTALPFCRTKKSLSASLRASSNSFFLVLCSVREKKRCVQVHFLHLQSEARRVRNIYEQKVVEAQQLLFARGAEHTHHPLERQDAIRVKRAVKKPPILFPVLCLCCWGFIVQLYAMLAGGSQNLLLKISNAQDSSAGIAFLSRSFIIYRFDKQHNFCEAAG